MGTRSSKVRNSQFQSRELHRNRFRLNSWNPQKGFLHYYPLFFTSIFRTLASPKLLAFGNEKKCFPFAFLSFFRNFMSRRAMKLGCIREKTKNSLVFPLICTNFAENYSNS